MDLPMCANIINDYIDATAWLPRVVSREKIASLFTAEILETRYFIVAENNAEVGGYLSMNEDDGHIIGLYVAPHFQNMGTGKLLLNEAKKRITDLVWLTVFAPNTLAKKFYEREGFAEDVNGRDYNTEEGVPTLLMKWGGAK